MKDFKWLKFIWSKLTMPLFILFFIISYYVSSRDLAKVSVQYPHFLLAVLSIILVLIVGKEVVTFRRENRAEAEEETPVGTEGGKRFADLFREGCRKWYKQIGYVLLFILYTAAIYYIGYYVSTLAFAAAMAWLLGIRKIPAVAAISLGITGAIYLMMTLWLKLSLPAGLLF